MQSDAIKRPLIGQRRKGSTAVWISTREGKDADGNRVIFARPENEKAESDFGVTDWLSMLLLK